METIADEQFQRVEKALGKLITSITTYNPNPSHAHELFSADKDLRKMLETLSKHQQNHARLQKLQRESQQLDTQIKDSIQLLVDTRRELIASPSTVFPENTNHVSCSQLLSYARRISKFTRPPTFREDEPEPEPESASREKSQTGTPIVANGFANTENGVDENDVSTSNNNSIALPGPINDWINPTNTAPTFVPWPSEEVIRRGALASIQVLIDQGMDPATFDPERSQELEAERRRREEDLDRQKEEAEVERRSRHNAANTQVGVQRTRQEPAVFTGLDLLDDDEDDV